MTFARSAVFTVMVSLLSAACDDAGDAGSTGSGSTAASSSGVTSSSSSGNPAFACAPLDPTCAGVIADFQPCGGDPSGTWKVQTICGETPSMLPDACMGEKQIVVASGGDGTISFDGTTMTRSGIFIHGVMIVVRKESCLQGSTCEAFTNDFLDKSPEGCCKTANGSCECHVPITAGPSDEAVPYEVDGTTIIRNGENAFDFCVSGSTLTLLEPFSMTVQRFEKQ